MYAAVNRAPLRPGRAAAYLALWEAVRPRVLAFPGCRGVTVLLDEEDGRAASVVLYDTLAAATAPPEDLAYWRTLAELDEILDLAGATREVYAVVPGAAEVAQGERGFVVGLLAWLAVAGGGLGAYGIEHQSDLARVGVVLAVVALLALFVAGGLGLLD